MNISQPFWDLAAMYLRILASKCLGNAALVPGVTGTRSQLQLQQSFKADNPTDQEE